ncbi:hypothetical protein [Niabella drilacis]|uniref:Uncharacterized protein n=1 Tax=Niabella drilacis (strain DSM 25811 / CCM 8410 / CCUG 62505 / LMG 26954 / E90) TaxID=1285928 RepID=A0A1G6SMQ6_NIADE|nr:hypothetical protein [Niabella drilacis]SDD18083.1 hypothetical protein SAMN04487894_106287 [Niabella drilacis]
MSRTRIVKGTYTKVTHGNHAMFSGANINAYANREIREKGAEEGVTHGDPEPAPASDLTFLIQVFDNNTEIKEGAYVFITEKPEMPKLRIALTIGKEYNYKKILFRLKTEFVFKASELPFDRKDVDYFPAGSGSGQSIFKEAAAGQTTSWDVDFGGIFRGGTATVEAYGGDGRTLIKKFVFYIRGRNPLKKTVKDYLISQQYLSKYWFVFKIIVSESGSEEVTVARQFWDPEYVKAKVKGKTKKVEAGYGPSGRGIESKGMPNYGFPDGWGVGQIDFAAEKRDKASLSKADAAWLEDLDKHPDYIWNWKKNIEIKMTRKIPEKVKAAVAQFNKLFKGVKKLSSFSQQEGLITYKTCPSTISEFSSFGSYMPDTASGDSEKSILDAELIKLYNGGHYITGIDAKDLLRINRLNSLGFNYNERIGNVKD